MIDENSNVPVILKDISEMFAQRIISKSDAVYVFSQIRRIIEQSIPIKYPVLRFYCNWSVHHRLRDSPIVYAMLEELTDILIGIDGDKDFHKRIPKALKFEIVRSEFIAFCTEYRLDSYWATELTNWNHIFGKLIFHLLQVPIEFPSIEEMQKSSGKYKNALAAYERIFAKTGGDISGVTGFRFTKVEENRGEILYWEIRTNRDYYHIQSSLTNIYSPNKSP